MKNLKITKRELLNLVLDSEFHCEPATLSGDNNRISDWTEIDYILNKQLSKTIVNRNLQTIDELSSVTSWNYLEDIIDEKNCTEKEAIDIFKKFLVCDTINNCLWEILCKLPYELPSSLSLNVHIDFLGTIENLENLEKSKTDKINFENRPSTSIEEMEIYIENNRQIIQEKLNYLNDLKKENNKENWQIEANALIQKVSNNDFRILKWKEIYELIKSKF